MSWCDSNDDHPGHDDCPGLPFGGIGATLAALPWNRYRPDRDALAIEADGTGPAAVAARVRLCTVPRELARQLGLFQEPAAAPTPMTTADGRRWLVASDGHRYGPFPPIMVRDVPGAPTHPYSRPDWRHPYGAEAAGEVGPL